MSDVIWQHSLQSNGYGGNFVNQYNHTIVYKKSNKFVLRNLSRTEEDNKLYKNPDNDPRGRWRMGYCVNSLYRPNLKYEIQTPSGQIINPPDKGWRWSKETLQQKIEAGEVIFNDDETNIIYKIYLDDLDGRVPTNLWIGGDAGTTRSSNAELKKIFDGQAPFDTPKPVELVERILQIATDSDSIILDSFAGSGTTAHAVLNLNAQDNGNRKFILVEMMPYAETITAERVRRVIDGYADKPGTGGGFDYYELGEPLLLPDGNLNENIPTNKVYEYIWFTETKTAYSPHSQHYLDNLSGTAYYFYYQRDSITTLDADFLNTYVSPEAGRTTAHHYVIYADMCAFDSADLERFNIVFKKIPRDISRL